MAFKYLDNYDLNDAIETFLKQVKLLKITPKTEILSVQQASGRITANAVIAAISAPHYSACAMDGIAVLASRTFDARESRPVILQEEIDFVRVDTGDPLPQQFDAVIMIEDVLDTGVSTVKILESATPWQHIRQIGEDICAGEMIIPSNTKIQPWAIGAMLAAGVLNVEVLRKPVAAIIPTGDEIVYPTENPSVGDIIEFNSSIFSAMLTEWGVESKVYPIVRDKYDEIKQALVKAAEECDIVFINAGSSAGREDYTSEAINDVGTTIVHGIAIKPGKPTILGIVNSKITIGLPGYPVSAIIVLDKVAKPIIKSVYKLELSEREHITANLSKKTMSNLKYHEFVRVKLGSINGKIFVTPLNRGAGVVTSFVKADGIMEIPLNIEGYDAGVEVCVELLRNKSEIENTIVIIGSHDPLIDIITDISKKNYDNLAISSAHVGSMGGIMAIKRNEAHIAGIHLLDEVTGEYNKSYIKKYIPDRKIALVNCVNRIQGIMVAPGNPLSITGLEDLSRPDMRYVNRQKGSGTRILLDYLLKQKNIDSGKIYGYSREEFTHMSVAVQIASGSADCGMGILSAAKAFGLNFIPICHETYDFIIPIEFINTNLIQSFIEILKSDNFRAQIDKLGGYELMNPGIFEILE